MGSILSEKETQLPKRRKKWSNDNTLLPSLPTISIKHSAYHSKAGQRKILGFDSLVLISSYFELTLLIFSCSEGLLPPRFILFIYLFVCLIYLFK